MELQKFKEYLSNRPFEMKSNCLNEIIKKFSFLYLTSDVQNIIQNLRKKSKSDIIIIDEFCILQSDNNPKDILIICYDYTLLIISLSDISENQEKDIQKALKKISNNFISGQNNIFFKEIQSLMENFGNNLLKCNPEMTLIRFSLKAISSFLIRVAHQNSQIDRRQRYGELFFVNEEELENDIKLNEGYVDLLSFKGGNFAKNRLIYLPQKEQIVLMKVFDDPEKTDNLFCRECENYLKFHHPLIPRYFGKTQYYSYDSLMIEYLEGDTLGDFLNKQKNLAKTEILKIILEIMIVLEYFHHNGLVYRDLKPDNIIINRNNTAFIIDFDRMVDVKFANEQHTLDFASDFIAPEIENYSFKSDIYSLGKVISFIINKVDPNKTMFSSLDKMIQKCTCNNENERPNINELIQTFFIGNFSKNDKIFQNDEIMSNKNIICDILTNFKYRFSECQNIESLINQSNSKVKFDLGMIYYDGKYVGRDIDKSIHYLSLASDQNNSEAQVALGAIYNNGEYVQKDINKSFHYFTLAANQNDLAAQFVLGIIYYSGGKGQRDINKSIHYLTLVANQNNSEAQLQLGMIYYDEDNDQRDIDKSIHYFTLAANQNNSEAQNNLGVIYYKGKYVKRDIDKSIHYFTLAANQNNSKAQVNLGMIYYDDKYIQRDIDKSIHYFTLAANQNNSDAQFQLGIIYYDDKYIQRDIDKSIHYFTLAANQNNLEAQFQLGMIYSNDSYVSQDINKSLHYLNLSANQNNSKAQYKLGMMYYIGEYVKQNINKSIQYLTLSANQNNSNAQFILGMIYYENKHISRDIKKCIHYLTLAANQNNSEAQTILGKFYYYGEYVNRDINKSIHYLTLAANQNNSDAQCKIGKIYYDGIYVQRDINKSIHYLTLAANQNNSDAQCKIGKIYYDGIYVTRDINKSIHYLTLAANQNNSEAQCFLGMIYYIGKHVPQDIKKSIHYLSSSGHQNVSTAQYLLGMIYLIGKGVNKDINKSIYYLSHAASLNSARAQCMLGYLYLNGFNVTQDVNKGLLNFVLAAENQNVDAKFAMGFIYHEGKYIKRDIEKAMHYYKDSSNFYNQYAKNNLGIIYKNGFEDKIQKNLGLAIEYFNEAIRYGNDPISMYNLAHLYLYEKPIENSIDESIKLLIKSLENRYESTIKLLLSLSLIDKVGFDLLKIKQEIRNITDEKSKIPSKICKFINKHELLSKIKYTKFYEYYRNVNYLYKYNFQLIKSNDLKIQKIIKKLEYPITQDFREGFGI